MIDIYERWIVRDGNGKYLNHTLSYSEENAKNKSENIAVGTWDKLEPLGYRAVRVTVTEVGK